MTAVQKNLANRQSSTTTTSYQSETVKAKSDTSYSSRTTNTHSTASQENPNAKRNKLSPQFKINIELEEVNSMLVSPLNLTYDQLMDRASAFEAFRKSYRKLQAMEENKELLKEKYARGKALGAVVNEARNTINKLKNQIEELRKERAKQGLLGNDDGNKLPEEDQLTSEIERQKKM